MHQSSHLLCRPPVPFLPLPLKNGLDVRQPRLARHALLRSGVRGSVHCRNVTPAPLPKIISTFS